jgi:tetratricopeptide (TPR) repeat protein
MKGKKDIKEQVEALHSQAKDVMNDTAVLVDERIQEAADIYRQAENLADESGMDDKKRESLLSNSARFFYEYGMYKEALSRYTHLIALRETLYGQENSATASAYHEIGETLRNLCDYPKALEYNMKALEIRKKILGEISVETAESYNDTGLVYIFQGHYDKASELFQKAKAICEEVVGTNHPGMAESYSNIGMLLTKQEDYSNALDNYLEALKIYESTLGDENRNTAVAYYGVGLSYYYMGNNSNALEYCSKAVRIYENVLGLNHPETAIIYTGIGFVHYNIGGLSQASDYFTKSLEISEKMLGSEHVNTAASYMALAWLKYKMDNNQGAIDYCEKSLNITEKILGLEHPDTAEAYYNMGYMYYLTDDNVKAYEYFLNAQQFYEKCARSEYIESKIENVKSYIELIEDKPEEESKGTRDLFLETLTKIGCQYEIDPDEGYISFGYQGENFVASATNDGWYVRLWDTYWGHVELYNVDEFSRLRKAVNHANLNCATMTIYTINEESNTVDVHCKSIFPFMPQMPNLEDYLRNELGDFFTAHHLVGGEMAKLRDQEGNAQAN